MKVKEVLAAFQEYYQTATINDVSDPNLIWELKFKLEEAKIFYMTEVTQFAEAFFSRNNARPTNICKPAAERWKSRHAEASGTGPGSLADRLRAAHRPSRPIPLKIVVARSCTLFLR